MKNNWMNFIKESLVEDFYNNQSAIEQKEGFETSLAFGTAGIRGKLGLGEGRLNRFTVSKVAIGLAQFLKSKNNAPVVVIHYDTRHLSPEFAQIIANILSNYKIKVYLSDTYRTTPDLSYAVRYLKADAGVMITASHNPKDYNGIKVYGDDGAQLSTEPSESLSTYINNLGQSLNIDLPNTTNNEKFILSVPNDVRENYFKNIKNLVGYIPKSNLNVVFTSLHGTSVPVVPNLLESLDFKQFHLVKSQCKPDPNFSSVESANPEDHKAFTEAIKLANEVDADLLISTDPDADRLGITERDSNGNIYYYNGNQIGALLLNYRIKQTSELNNRIMIQSIVSSNLAKSLASFHQIQFKEVLTGFKYIAKEIKNLPNDYNFIFGYEESYGFLASPFVRDKDAVQIVPLIIKYASELKNEGKMLKDELEEIYKRIGNYNDKLFSHTFEGIEGKAIIENIMKKFRNNSPSKINELDIIAIEDFESGEKLDKRTGEVSEITLPKANVLKIYFEEGFIALRPSGTEPKIKLYVSLTCNHFDMIANQINDYIFN
ncbi:phospho-sugar mutase [Staphylococcus caprae]|uniref:phospho-sugar mutase n=1 Tax=Staphylococcus caprae TaxID=29380 RepID=UPI003B20FA78